MGTPTSEKKNGVGSYFYEKYEPTPCFHGHVFKPFDACVIWGKWRLVQGEELYDVEADRAQQVNLADKHPDVLKVMWGHYETWWKGVEPRRNETEALSRLDS